VERQSKSRQWFGFTPTNINQNHLSQSNHLQSLIETFQPSTFATQSISEAT
jgi:hypothetical protein